MHRKCRIMRSMATGIIMAGLLNACTVGPDYARPAVETPQHYKEEELAPTPSGVHWHIANPAREPAQGEWWKIYRDPKLNLLAEQVSISNQNVIAAEAQLRQARALVQQARAGFFPTITGGPSITRTQQSSTLGARPVARIPLTDYSLGADLTWEIDLWGRIRRTVEASRASFARFSSRCAISESDATATAIISRPSSVVPMENTFTRGDALASARM